MNNFIFENTTKTYFGKGCVKEYLACLLKHFGENVMFAYGKGSIKENGVYDEIMESLSKAGKNITEFSDIMPNPTYTKVLEGAKLARDNQIDFILAAGGGSVIDCCKAVSMAAVYEGDAAMAGNRILKLGKRTDFQCRRMGNQLAADENTELKQIADSCMLSAGNGR